MQLISKIVLILFVSSSQMLISMQEKKEAETGASYARQPSLLLDESMGVNLVSVMDAPSDNNEQPKPTDNQTMSRDSSHEQSCFSRYKRCRRTCCCATYTSLQACASCCVFYTCVAGTSAVLGAPFILDDVLCYR